MLIFCISILLALIAGMLYGGGKQRPLDRDEMLALQRYHDKIHREQAQPFE